MAPTSNIPLNDSLVNRTFEIAFQLIKIKGTTPKIYRHVPDSMKEVSFNMNFAK